VYKLPVVAGEAQKCTQLRPGVWGLQAVDGRHLFRVRLHLPIPQQESQERHVLQPQEDLGSARLEVGRLQHGEHLLHVGGAVRVAPPARGQVIDELPNDAAQPSCMDDGADCTLEGRGPVPQAKG
jgi:hypothetical protein